MPIGWMHCNLDAFQAHCKAHREYWEWVTQRNDERYQTNAQHGRGYDSKNLMHTLCLAASGTAEYLEWIPATRRQRVRAEH